MTKTAKPVKKEKKLTTKKLEKKAPLSARNTLSYRTPVA
jgi:hypothetical protein